MTTFGLTASGFVRKRYADILQEKEQRAIELFGSDVSLSESSPLGQFIRLNAWEEAILWQTIENVYYSGFVTTAEGTALDALVQYIGVRRLPSRKAIGEVTFTGTNGTVIPSGFVIATDDVRFRTMVAVEVSGGTADVAIEAVDNGAEGNISAGLITEMVVPIIGIDTVTNANPTYNGRDRERDIDLRYRYLQSVARGGASTIESIRASLLNVEDVRAALVVANISNDVDGDGRPPKSFESYVLGGYASDIASAIFATGAAGIQPYGVENATVVDSSGNEHTIGFTRATEIPIYVDVSVSVNEEFDIDGVEQIVTEIIRYIGGEDIDGQFHIGLSMGQDVVFTQLIKAAYRVRGIIDIEIAVGVTENPIGTDNISIGTIDVAETDHTRIQVTINE